VKHKYKLLAEPMSLSFTIIIIIIVSTMQ